MFTKFNFLWENYKSSKPLVVLIGGAAGTGKSTLANDLASQISSANILCTSLVRSISADIYPDEHEKQLLNTNTYNLINEEQYLEQSRIVLEHVNGFVEFLKKESQNYIIEGSNIVPGLVKFDPKELILVELYLSVGDPLVHEQMMAGPTHNRSFSQNDLVNNFKIQNLIISRAEKFGKKVFDISRGGKYIQKYINKEIEDALVSYGTRVDVSHNNKAD